MINIKIFHSMRDIPLKQADWDRLVQKSANVGVFSRHFWITNWWRFFGKEYELCFLTADDDGRIIAFAPLMIDKDGELRFIGDSNADYLDFVISRDRELVMQRFLEMLAGIQDKWRVMHLRNIPRSQSDDKTLITQARNANLYPWMNYAEVAPYLKISDNADVVASTIGKYSVRRSNRLLAQQGTIRFRNFTTAGEADEYWLSFRQQNMERCRQVGRHSSFSNPDYLPFLRSLFESDTDREHVLFSAVFMDDRPIAFHFGYISQKRLLWYKPSFDISIEKGSPGISLICHLIQYAQEHGLSELDFTIGDEAFKDRFCSGKRTVESFRIHRSFPRYAADAGHWWLREKVKAALGLKGT